MPLAANLVTQETDRISAAANHLGICSLSNLMLRSIFQDNFQSTLFNKGLFSKNFLMLHCLCPL